MPEMTLVGAINHTIDLALAADGRTRWESIGGSVVQALLAAQQLAQVLQ